MLAMVSVEVVNCWEVWPDTAAPPFSDHVYVAPVSGSESEAHVRVVVSPSATVDVPLMAGVLAFTVYKR